MAADSTTTRIRIRACSEEWQPQGTGTLWGRGWGPPIASSASGRCHNGGAAKEPFVEFQPISPEEMQRTVQFLLQQQAQFVADSAASQARFDARLEQVTSGLVGLTAIVGQVVDSVSQIAAAQKRTDEQLRATDARLSERLGDLSEHITTVESHLDVVIEMFERHLREDHGHRTS